MQNQFIVNAVLDQMRHDKLAAVCRLFLHLPTLEDSKWQRRASIKKQLSLGSASEPANCSLSYLDIRMWGVFFLFFTTECFPGTPIMKAMKNSWIYLTDIHHLLCKLELAEFQNNTTWKLAIWRVRW